MRKHPFLVIVTAAWIFCGLAFAHHSCRAEEPKKVAALPSKLSELDFTRLKLAIATRELAQQRAQRAADEFNTADAEIDQICKDYKIARAQLDHSVNAKTGEIIRMPELLMPKEEPTKKQAAKK
jgi:hypothetical protein